MDLFENYDNQPKKLSDILNKFDLENMSYKSCEEMLKEVEKIGYTFDYGLDSEPYNLRKIQTMHINAALKIIGDKFPLLKETTIKAATNEKDLINILEYILSQYKESPGNRNRLNKMLGNDVIKCLKDKAEEINYWAEIKLANLQALEGGLNMN